MRKITLFTLMLFIAAAGARADEVTLANGDRLSGRILSEDKTTITLEHEAAGTITLKRAFVKKVQRAEPEAEIAEAAAPEAPAEVKPDREWKRELALGASISSGNTEEEQFSGKLFANGKGPEDEWTFSASGYLSESDGEAKAERYDGMGRYGASFGDQLAWYHFYMAEATHDRFANIKLRLTPSAGVGYWFSDEEKWKAMAEAGLGVEWTRFRDNTARRTDPVGMTRAFVEKHFSGNSILTQNFTLWPNLSDVAEYRFKSETVFTNPVTERLNLKFSLVDEYQSEPGAGTKKNDVRLTSELELSF